MITIQIRHDRTSMFPYHIYINDKIAHTTKWWAFTKATSRFRTWIFARHYVNMLERQIRKGITRYPEALYTTNVMTPASVPRATI